MWTPTRSSSPMTVLQGVAVTLTAVMTLCTASLSRCPENYYMTSDSDACRPCSTCPKNQIIRRPCTKDSNTLCGPFVEFHEFHQAPRPSLDVGDLPSPDEGGGGGGGVLLGVGGDGMGWGGDSDSNRSKKIKDLLESLDKEPTSEHHNHNSKKHGPHHNHHHKGGHPGAGRGKGENQLGKDPEGYDEHVEVYPDVSGSRNPSSFPGYHNGVASRPRQQDKQVPSLTSPDDGENQWKVLALALIVVLCVVCVFLIVFVFVVCYMRSRRAHMKKVLYSAGNSPMARSTARSTAFNANSYVPVFTHAQGRAGTSGGAMSAPPCGMVDSSYLYSEEYDADHSGQTISTTKSSDYVYFKTPQNGSNNVHDV
ncbi:uncharacterized protein [Littorina saxatilis]|uniref:TNFR-Cys domain-containing protein n=1 Tax=Littorina saxatilis TaxID=31220 RepID=A0AAN9B5I8_9CAEN